MLPEEQVMQGPMQEEMMQPQMPMGEVSQMEMQEAQGALQQILQVMDMLIQQGLSAEEIAQFLEQYGISEDELEQAAQVLGVDINQLLGGQMQAPQEPMMMAAGGPSQIQLAHMQPTQMPIMQQPQMQQPQLGLGSSMDDNEPRFEDRSRENQIFSLKAQINNLMNDYNIAVNDKDFNTAQKISDQINNIDVAITQLKSQMPISFGEKKN